ncbi:MAG: hypothetical protein R3A51_01990 [Nannocystaceae bacterium]
MPRVVSVVVRIVLVVNLLDLTTSIPSAYNHAVGERSAAALVVQLALAVVGVIWIVRRLPGWLRALWRAPIPAPARLILGGVLIVQIIYIALKIERYPLTNVGMFTFRITPWRDPQVLRDQYLYRGEDGPQVLSVRRFGDPLFALGARTDFQTALLLWKYRRHPAVQDEVALRARQVGIGPLLLAHIKVQFDRDGAHIVGVRPLAPREAPSADDDDGEDGE